MRRVGCLVVLMMATMAQSAALAAPLTLDHPGKKCRFISLAEARAIALERGTIGQPSLLFPGIGLDNSVAVPQGDATIPVRVCCKSGSKCLILRGVSREARPAEIERNVNQMLLNVENAYWNLYGSYWQLNSSEQGLRFAYETWKITQTKSKDGKIGRAAVAQAEGQYNLFRTQRLAALDTVLDNERQLRAMLGLPIQDGTRLVPSDAPTLVEQKPDWKEGWRTAMKKRPELQLAREDVEKAKLYLLAVKKVLRPLRQIFGLENGGEHPQTAEQHCVIRCAAHLCDPNAPPSVRDAQIRLARAQLVLQDQELKAERFLGLYYRRMSSAYFQIKAARAQREAFATQLRIRYELYRSGANEPGTDTPVTLNLLLEAQRFWAEALASEYAAIVTYNNSIAGWDYAKGDIMKHAHVRVVEEAPERSKIVPAVEREQKRTRQHVRREPGVMANSPLTAPDACQDSEDAKAVSLVALWKCFPLLKQAGELHSSDATGPLVEYRVSEIFPPRRKHPHVSR